MIGELVKCLTQVFGTCVAPMHDFPLLLVTGAMPLNVDTSLALAKRSRWELKAVNSLASSRASVGSSLQPALE
jgi:hypothetical protein